MQIILVLELFISLLLGYFGHVLQIRLSKKKIIDKRLLDNINEIERFISYINEIQFERNNINEIVTSINNINSYIKNASDRLDEITTRNDKDENEITILEHQIDIYLRIQKRIQEDKSENDIEENRILDDISAGTYELEVKLQNNKTNIDETISKIKETKSELSKVHQLSRDTIERLNLSKKRLVEIQKLIALSDIDTICLAVDPKGKLGNQINSLLNFCKTGGDRDEILQTKITINKILNERIMNG
jgi:chromosome segregation ATPase